VKGTVLYALASGALIGVAWVVLGALFPDDQAQRAFRLSAGLAFLVQMIGFAIARFLAGRKGGGGRDVMIGWGIGSLLRVGTLIVYALVFVRAGGLPMAPSLISLAVFFFVTMLVEPILLQI
jgi:hypothetical protein